MKESHPRFQVEALDAKKHRREEFRCESGELNEFLWKRARKEMEARASVCFVLAPVEDPGRIAGFYTLSAAVIRLGDLPADIGKKVPKYPVVPATLLGRLARDISFRGQGIGGCLMISALHRAWRASQEIGSAGVLTDPKDQPAREFYRQFGFLDLDCDRMFLPMAGVAGPLGP